MCLSPERIEMSVICPYSADADLVKSGFEGEHTEPNHRLMYT